MRYKLTRTQHTFVDWSGSKHSPNDVLEVLIELTRDDEWHTDEDSYEYEVDDSHGCVYIVNRGEQHEGGCVVGVFENESKALKHAYMLMDESEDKWTRQGTRRVWHCGCDYIDITTHTVR